MAREPDPDILRLTRALARQAAREDHEQEMVGRRAATADSSRKEDEPPSPESSRHPTKKVPPGR